MAKKETVKELGDVEFVGLAKQLLDSSIKSSQVMDGEPYTPETAKYAKLVLGNANMFLNAFKTKMSYWKFTGVKNTIKTLQGVDKKRYK